MKKIISLAASVVMFLALSTPSFADASTPVRAESNAVFNSSNQLVENSLIITPKSTSVPTSFYDLSTAPYNANMDLISTGYLYTNYYFKPNSSGNINVDFSVISENGAQSELRISIYDIAAGKHVASWDSDDVVDSRYTNGSMHFYNLDTSKKYAISFKAVNFVGSNGTITGSAKIYW